jgi:ABC-type lipoprotein export system ATPase subunit
MDKFIFATRDPRVMAFARRVVKMRDGRLIDDGASNNG